jgi:hypothetical protein
VFDFVCSVKFNEYLLPIYYMERALQEICIQLCKSQVPALK